MKSNSGGFSLLEAVVAIVLLSTTGIALYSWINSSLISVNRVRDIIVEQQVIKETMPYIETINPMASETGQVELGIYQISWRSALIEDVKEGVGVPDGASQYQLGLYILEVSVRSEGRDVSYSTRRVGYKKVRDFSKL